MVFFQRLPSGDIEIDTSTEEQIRQILLTRGLVYGLPGELPYDTFFGSGLHTMKHDVTIAKERAAHFVRTALQKYLPNVQVTRIEIDTEQGKTGNSLSVVVEYLEGQTVKSVKTLIPVE